MTSLAEAVTEDPRRARIFEAYGLDFCCHGDRTIDEACAVVGIDSVEVKGALDRLIGEPLAPADWTRLRMGELVEHIQVVHHRYVRDEVPRLTHLMEKVLTVHGEAHPELVQVARLFRELTDTLLPHLEREELDVFPFVRAVAAGADPDPAQVDAARAWIGELRAEHDQTGDLLARLRQATGGYRVPGDGCGSYRALYAGLAELVMW
jgi:regulator of cell morphogenesis and NO signaling